MLILFIRSVIFASVINLSTASQLKRIQKNHQPQQLSNTDIKYLANLSNRKYTNDVLDRILVPRVVGTENHEMVFNYIKNELQSLNWNIEVDEFNGKTPNFGVLTFKNLIATLNPNAERYLVLACHYDSKYFKNDIFVGATDSAVPCAMMLNLAKVMEKEFANIKDNSELSLKLIFFDGEEAFVNWGPNDSIYGARHLAAKYDRSKSLIRSTGESVTDLEKIDILVLLDLIGHKDCTFYSYFADTSDWYLRLSAAEDRLKNLGLLKKNKTYFLKRMSYSRIEDDHIPFLQKNVPILHVIASPFPTSWHTSGDNRDIVDENSVEDINRILRVFVTEYLHIYLDSSEDDIPEKEL